MNDYLKDIKLQIEQEKNYEDDVSGDDIAPAHYDVTSYGIDFDVDGLVKRIRKGSVYIPEFQRKFVWKMPESSRFIESLLLGLPVPGIFLAQDFETKKLLVIDGQQRLLSLKYFYDGYFNPKKDSKTQRVFKLTKVQELFNGKSYEMLDENNKRNLDDCVIHATVVKQDYPEDDDTSIFHIFERLNSGGRKFEAQEIRAAIYQGSFLDTVNELNEYSSWRKIFGHPNDRMKDHELIIRFFAMFEIHEEYKKPMAEFINKYMKKNRNAQSDKLNWLSSLFKTCTDLFTASVENNLFRPVRSLNIAFFESAMVGLAKRIVSEGEPTEKQVRTAYKKLLETNEFVEAISSSTTDVAQVEKRLSVAENIFMEV